MKDDSFLIFETGNLGDVDQTYFKYFQRFQYPDHLFFFSTDNIVELLEKTGFEFIQIYRYSILPQLRVKNNLFGIKNSIRRCVLKSNEKVENRYERIKVAIQCAANTQSSNAKSTIKNIVRYLNQYFNYVLRYKIGRIAPKAHRPQTVIVVAKKKQAK